MLFRKNHSRKDLQALDDGSLVGLYRENQDMQVLGLLFERYTGLVFGVCMKYFKDEEESKDAVMQIFETLVENLKKHEVNNFRSWLHVVTKNHCLMKLRASKNKYFQNIEEISPEKSMEYAYALHPDSENDIELQLETLNEAMESLSDEQKKCVQLFYLEQKCYKEIQEITGFELKKVKSYIQNGRRNLKIFMEKQ